MIQKLTRFKVSIWSGVGVAFLFLALAGFLAVNAVHESHARADLARQNCEAIEHLKSYAYDAAIRGIKALPTLAYYREHPDELKQAKKSLEDQARFFAPEPCT